MKAKRWSVQVHLTEDGDETRASAVLDTGDTSDLRGVGMARRNPVDDVVPEVGDEFAASRALGNLAMQLRSVAYEDLAELVVKPQEPGTLRPPTTHGP